MEEEVDVEQWKKQKQGSICLGNGWINWKAKYVEKYKSGWTHGFQYVIVAYQSLNKSFSNQLKKTVNTPAYKGRLWKRGS